MSELNQLHSCIEEKPELYETVQLYFEDDHRETGRWTGRFWWSHGHEVVPVCWQHVEPHLAGSPKTAQGLRQ